MTRIQIKTWAITVIALLAAPTAAFAASSDDGYSPPGGEPQLAFTGRDLYLWGGLGLLLVGVGLGLRRLTSSAADPKDKPHDEVAAGDGASPDYGSTEVALPEPGAEPAPTVAASSAPLLASSSGSPLSVSGGAEPTIAAGALSLDAPPREPRRERGAQRDRTPATVASVPVVRPRDRSPLALEYGVAQALVEAGDERGLLEVAAAHLAGALDAEGGAVVARQTEGSEPTVLARAGSTADSIDRRDGAADASLTEGRVVRRATESGHELAAPVPVDGRVWGAVAVESPAAFTDGDADLAASLAAQVGLALGALWAVREADGDVFAARKLTGLTEESLSQYREVARLAMTVGSKLGVPDGRLKTLYIAGLFHDIGLAGVPHELTARQGRLSDEERRVVDQHPLTGARLMRQSARLREAGEIVRHLGEHYDGTGIPEGLSGASIPLESRILAATVAWVSLTSDRPSHAAMDAGDAALVLRAARGTQFDPDAVDAILESVPAELATA